jgi:hypothetical protein
MTNKDFLFKVAGGNAKDIGRDKSLTNDSLIFFLKI